MPGVVSGNGLLEELRSLYDRLEFETLLTRCDRILNPSLKSRKQKSKRKSLHEANSAAGRPSHCDGTSDVLRDRDRKVVRAARASALLRLGQEGEALGAMDEVEALCEDGEDDKIILDFIKRARPYAMWRRGVDLEKALELAQEVEGKDGQFLRGQILYRMGEHEKAGEVYEEMLSDKVKTLNDLKLKKKRGVGGRFAFVGRLRGKTEGNRGGVTEEMIEQVEEGMEQIATNLAAALALKGNCRRIEEVREMTRKGYEMEYNMACAAIEEGKLDVATRCLEHAEDLCRTDAVEDGEEDVETDLTPLRVQKAYLLHRSGKGADAQAIYSSVVESEQVNSATLAVATNNMTVLQAERLLQSGSQFIGEVNEERERRSHNRIAEGVRRMKAAAGWSVERKLTDVQRRAIARNRAILLFFSNRYEACQAEIERLKESFPEDPLLPVIEAALLARAKGYDAADRVLRASESKIEPSTDIIAARAQLAINMDKPDVAAMVVKNTFGQRPAGLVTTAALMEMAGKGREAAALLKDQESVEARIFHADILLRAEEYKEAAEGYRRVLEQQSDNKHVLAPLVVATSYLDPKEAECLAEKLDGESPQAAQLSMDIKALEASQPPRRARTRQTQVAPGSADASAAMGKKKRRKRKKRLPKNYDPNGPPADPERWLPKTRRSGYKKKRRRETVNFKGSQGADAAAVEEAAVKNGKKSAARGSTADVKSTVPARPRGKKKSRRRR